MYTLILKYIHTYAYNKLASDIKHTFKHEMNERWFGALSRKTLKKEQKKRKKRTSPINKFNTKGV